MNPGALSLLPQKSLASISFFASIKSAAILITSHKSYIWTVWLVTADKILICFVFQEFYSKLQCLLSVLMLLQSGEAELGIITHYSPCSVSSTTHLPQNTRPAFPCSSHWAGCDNDRDQGQCQGALLALQLLPSTHRKCIRSLSLGSTHAFLWSCSWCLTLQGMNFPNQAEVPLLSGFSLLAVTPVCLTYRQRSHLSPCSSPAHPTAQHCELQAPHDNTPKQK